MSRLAPVSQASWICLRCQARLSLNRLPISARKRHPLTIKSHSDSHPRSITQSSNSRQDNTQNADTADTTHPSRIRQHDNFDAKDPPPKIPLGMESMGEAAEILVLPRPAGAPPNLGVLFPTIQKKLMPTGLKKSSAALLDDIRNQQGVIDVDIDEACANIDRVKDAFFETRRRRSTTTLAAEEYSKLLSDLTAGFGKKHLMAYWSRKRQNPVADMAALNLYYPYSSTLLARSAWTPNVTSLEQAQAPPLGVENDTLVEATLRGGTLLDAERRAYSDRRKQWHAKNLIRDCWGIHEEQDNTNGQLVLRLQKTHLQLLLSHASDPLRKASKEYAAKLEVSRTKGLIRIECDFVSSEEVVRTIVHNLESIKSSVVYIGAPKAEVGKAAAASDLEDDYLNEVQTLTNTVIIGQQAKQKIRSMTSPSEYTVYYLGPDEIDFEDAQRLLNVHRVGSMNTQPSRTLVETPLPSTTSIIPVDFGSGIPLVARNIPLARFAQPNTRQSATALKLRKHLPLSESVEAVDRVMDFFASGPDDKAITKRLCENPYHYWSRKAIPWSRVVLGQVAFPLHDARKMESKLKKLPSDSAYAYPDITKICTSDVQRIFATSVPRITRVLGTSNTSLIPTETLVIRMLPASSSDLPSAVTDGVPQLEILIDLDVQEQRSSFARARLVLAHDELDLLLPAHTTDVRFTNRIYLYSDREHMDPCLRDFVNASNFAIWGSERLRTPNDLRITVPVGSIARSIDDDLENVKGVRQVDYKFASLEHRSGLDLPPTGLSQPQYTIIEAGRLGGRREELAMEGNPRPYVLKQARKTRDKPGDPEPQRSVKSLLDAASSMIQSLEQDRAEQEVYTLIE